MDNLEPLLKQVISEYANSFRQEDGTVLFLHFVTDLRKEGLVAGRLSCTEEGFEGVELEVPSCDHTVYIKQLAIVTETEGEYRRQTEYHLLISALCTPFHIAR